MVPPPPGMIPSIVPITDPIACGLARRRHIAGLGKRIRVLARSAFCQPGSPLCASSSPIANRPTITRIGGIPDSSSGLPKVKRFSPVTGSVPTVAIISPSSPAISPLINESPETDAMTLRPSTPSAKYDVGVNARATRDNGSGQQDQHEEPEQPADET